MSWNIILERLETSQNVEKVWITYDQLRSHPGVGVIPDASCQAIKKYAIVLIQARHFKMPCKHR